MIIEVKRVSDELSVSTIHFLGTEWSVLKTRGLVVEMMEVSPHRETSSRSASVRTRDVRVSGIYLKVHMSRGRHT